jgi:uncharacterized repeat protein (TIGR03803 family)
MAKMNLMAKACVAFLLWAAAAVALPAQTFTALYSFDGTGGANPYAGLIQGTDGNFYGTTSAGGANVACTTQFTVGCGTVFKITPRGTLTTLYSFCSLSDCADGEYPLAGLVQGANGDFYGTTEFGGVGSTCSGGPCGTVFKITPTGTLTTLHSFAGTDGEFPYAGLVQATNGDFYGTTLNGGANQDCLDSFGALTGCGTVFKITPSGTLTTLYSFCSLSDCPDGAIPYAGVVQATNGDFYGATAYGGPNCAGDGGCGTAFKMTPSGTLTTLHSFRRTDGEYPTGALVQGTNGDFYGTTYYGGDAYCLPPFGCGTVFKITAGGTLTTLVGFDLTDGFYPYAGLVQGADGNFYGTTSEGGSPGVGTVFEITPTGGLTTLYQFGFDGPYGDYPYSGLIQGTDGSFYGTTEYGGNTDLCDTEDYEGCGVVFRLSLGLRQFVETQPTSGPVGGSIEILGTDLTGATSVTFDGTAAAFTVDSHSLITATVPAGATTGKVEVTVPSGTLSSNVPFTVRP